LKPLQIQNLKIKTWETEHIISPPSKKVEGHVPRVAHLIAPMITPSQRLLVAVNS